MRRLVTLFGGDDFSRRGEDVCVRSGREGRKTAGGCVIDAGYGRAVARGAQTRAFSGLKDQDRIFQNIYGEHDTSIQGAMRRGDWYQTDKIVQKVPLPALV